jgi:type II restriction enzyme
VKPKFIKRAADLVTSHQAVCEGFLSQALTKTQKAIPFIQDAVLFWRALQKVRDVKKLLKLTAFREHLLAAAGFSDKARNNLSQGELQTALQKVFDTTFCGAGANFREEILYRYLLTKGDSFGGTMRNVTGATAQAKLCAAITTALKSRNLAYSVVRADSQKIQRLAWGKRLLLFDVTPKIIGKNIDLVLVERRAPASEAALLADRKAYRACGELKGGIDPAGADEHWKTANTALNRIRKALRAAIPPLFFVGAAIVESVARDVYADLSRGKLTHAANLNVNEQVQDLAEWLVGL